MTSRHSLSQSLTTTSPFGAHATPSQPHRPRCDVALVARSKPQIPPVPVLLPHHVKHGNAHAASLCDEQPRPTIALPLPAGLHRERARPVEAWRARATLHADRAAGRTTGYNAARPRRHSGEELHGLSIVVCDCKREAQLRVGQKCDVRGAINRDAWVIREVSDPGARLWSSDWTQEGWVRNTNDLVVVPAADEELVGQSGGGKSIGIRQVRRVVHPQLQGLRPRQFGSGSGSYRGLGEQLAVFRGSLHADGHRDSSDARQEGYAAGNAVHLEPLHQLARLYAHHRDRARAEVAHGHETLRKHSDSDRLVEHARRGGATRSCGAVLAKHPRGRSKDAAVALGAQLRSP
eukprot:scaffold30826_cov67-Phaeocystis_antarctica.AAC.2